MYFTHPQLKFNIKNLLLFLGRTDENELRDKLAEFFPNREIIFINSGRSAFQIAIEELGLRNSEMLVPAYICDIFLPIFEHYNIKPIFLDIDLKTFNINPEEIEGKITPETKSILICHTYGLPNDIDKILEIAKKYNLKIIEDCAHTFGSKFNGIYLGNFGECAFFSLPKFLPVINGGILVSKTPLQIELKKDRFKLSNIIKSIRLFPSLATFSEKFRIDGETLANQRFSVPKKTSKLSLKIFNQYLNDFEKNLKIRIELAKYFQEKLQKIGFQTSRGTTYISALVPKNINRDELFKKIRKKNIFCSRIWHKPIILNKEQFPNVFEAAKRIINFPLQNWFTEKDIDKIIAGILSTKG